MLLVVVVVVMLMLPPVGFFANQLLSHQSSDTVAYQRLMIQTQTQTQTRPDQNTGWMTIHLASVVRV